MKVVPEFLVNWLRIEQLMIYNQGRNFIKSFKGVFIVNVT